ncbi:MAG: carbonic anhydrase, partial [Candidatus Heimdallarchaeota archaeon]|nr:carbonic anhydrase [Candidatus Heimdallarchaeota archaeon]
MFPNDEITPDDALKKLLDGNERYVNNKRHEGSGVSNSRRLDVSKAQKPYAIVFTCSDSRVPPEYVFDSGIGDIFVIRNAGNILSEIALGSIEYAALFLKTPLLLILGHTNCGAIHSTIKAFKNPEEFGNSHIDSIIERLLPAVISAKEKTDDSKKWQEQSLKQNLEMVSWQAKKNSNVLSDMIKEGKMLIKTAIYDTVSGKVELL